MMKLSKDKEKILPKKICFIADAASPHARKWVEGCRDLGWEMLVISHRPGEIRGAKVAVHPLTLTGFLRYCWGVRRLVREFQPDLVHAHQFGAHALYAWFAGGAPLIVSAWGSDILVKAKQSLPHRLLVRFLAPKAVLITSVSRQVTDELIRLKAKPSRILTFPHGIKREQYRRLVKYRRPETPIVICSPRLHEPIYNIKPILEAFRQIVPTFPGIELWVLGDGSLTQELKQYALNHRLEKIRFWGRVSPERFTELIAQSHIFVSIPSSDGTPVSMIEGMAAGSLPILSDLPVYHDWVVDGKNGLIIKNDFSNLKEALLQGIQDPELRRRAAAINQARIEASAIWEEQFQKMLDFYRAVGVMQ